VTSVNDLNGIPLFAGLTDEERASLAEFFEVSDASPGRALVTEGASGYSFYVLIDGAAEVTVGGETVATYGPGDFFGEMAILGGGRRNATVTITTPSRLLSMFGTEFRMLQEVQPDVAARLQETMRQRAAELDELQA
jgi:CPA1 family monovalent cation:H+ antiporter